MLWSSLFSLSSLASSSLSSSQLVVVVVEAIWCRSWSSRDSCGSRFPNHPKRFQYETCQNRLPDASHNDGSSCKILRASDWHQNAMATIERKVQRICSEKWAENDVCASCSVCTIVYKAPDKSPYCKACWRSHLAFDAQVQLPMYIADVQRKVQRTCSEKWAENNVCASCALCTIVYRAPDKTPYCKACWMSHLAFDAQLQLPTYVADVHITSPYPSNAGRVSLALRIGMGTEREVVVTSQVPTFLNSGVQASLDL